MINKLNLRYIFTIFIRINDMTYWYFLIMACNQITIRQLMDEGSKLEEKCSNCLSSLTVSI